MNASKTYDWTSVDTAAAMAEWLRAEAGALCVLVIRCDDAVLAADAGLAPADAAGLIEEYTPGLAADLAGARKEKRAAARVELGELHE